METVTWKDFCPCCGSGPGERCDEICEQIQKEISESTEEINKNKLIEAIIKEFGD